MTITIPEDRALALLAQLPNTAEAEELKGKLRAGLDKSKNLVAKELELVLAILERQKPEWLPTHAMGTSQENDGAMLLHRLRSAQSKLRTLYARQAAREQGRG